MKGTISIQVDTTDDAMGSFGEFDPCASVTRFLQKIHNEVHELYPDYEIQIEETEHANTVVISDDREYGRGVEEDQQVIREIISDVYQRGDWYVAA